MNVLETPPVPTLSDFRLSTRQEHLVQEIAGRRRNRRRGGLALGGGALVASGVTTALLVLAGPGTANAFAAWTAAPTTPAPGQVSSAEATCEAAAATPPPDKTAGLATGATQVSLVDTRGPFTLVLFGANTSTTLMCVSGPSINSSAQANSQMTVNRRPAGVARGWPDCRRPAPSRIRQRRSGLHDRRRFGRLRRDGRDVGAERWLGRRHHNWQRSLPCLVAW